MIGVFPDNFGGDTRSLLGIAGKKCMSGIKPQLVMVGFVIQMF